MMKLLVLLYLIVFTISIENPDFCTPSPENTNISVSLKKFQKEHAAKDKIKEAATPTPFWVKESAQDAASGVSSKAKEQAHDGFEAAKKVKDEVKRKGEELVGSAGEGQKGLFKNVVSPLSGLLLHLLGFAAAYGTCAWFTLASTYVMAGALPRLQFEMLQSKMYAVYFKAMAGCVGMALLGYLMMSSQIRRASSIVNLMASLAMILVNMIYLEPRTTKMAFERMKKEKEEHATESHTTDTSAASVSQGEGETKEATTRSLLVRLGLNSSNTSLLNVATLVSLTCHLLQLAQQLHAVC